MVVVVEGRVGGGGGKLFDASVGVVLHKCGLVFNDLFLSKQLEKCVERVPKQVPFFDSWTPPPAKKLLFIYSERQSHKLHCIDNNLRSMLTSNSRSKETLPSVSTAERAVPLFHCRCCRPMSRHH